MLSRRFADLLLEQAVKVAEAHGGALGKRGDGQVSREIVSHPGEQVPERLALAGLSRERCAELRLAAGAPQKYHHHARDLERNRRSQIFFHQSEREINTRRDASGRINVLVSNIDRMRVYLYQRMLLNKLTAPVPMGSRGPSVE